jgi:hypothetical protein
MSVENIFQFGPQGRGFVVDASGAIVASEGGGPFLVYAFGPQGFPLAVDPNGRLHVRTSAPAQQTDSPDASGTIDLDAAKTFDIILDKDVVWTSFDNPLPGAKYTFILEQTGSGSFTATWPSNVQWVGGTPPTLTAASGSVDVVTMLYRERNDTFLAEFNLDFQ